MKSVQTNNRFSLQELLEFFRPHTFKLATQVGLPDVSNLVPMRTNLIKRLSQPSPKSGKDLTVRYIRRGPYAGVETLAAIYRGEDIIVGGLLQSRHCETNPPFLVRTHGVNSLAGRFHYEVWACVDNPPTDPLLLVELCAAAEALDEAIGAMPKFVHIAAANGQVYHFETEALTVIYEEIKRLYLQSGSIEHSDCIGSISNLSAFRNRKAHCGGERLKAVDCEEFVPA